MFKLFNTSSKNGNSLEEHIPSTKTKKQIEKEVEEFNSDFYYTSKWFVYDYGRVAPRKNIVNTFEISDNFSIKEPYIESLPVFFKRFQQLPLIQQDYIGLILEELYQTFTKREPFFRSIFIGLHLTKSKRLKSNHIVPFYVNDKNSIEDKTPINEHKDSFSYQADDIIEKLKQEYGLKNNFIDEFLLLSLDFVLVFLMFMGYEISLQQKNNAIKVWKDSKICDTSLGYIISFSGCVFDSVTMNFGNNHRRYYKFSNKEKQTLVDFFLFNPIHFSNSNISSFIFSKFFFIYHKDVLRNKENNIFLAVLTAKTEQIKLAHRLFDKFKSLIDKNIKTTKEKYKSYKSSQFFQGRKSKKINFSLTLDNSYQPLNLSEILGDYFHFEETAKDTWFGVYISKDFNLSYLKEKKNKNSIEFLFKAFLKLATDYLKQANFFHKPYIKEIEKDFNFTLYITSKKIIVEVNSKFKLEKTF